MNTSTDNRLWVGGSILLCVAIIAMGWFLGVSPKLSEAAAAGSQLSVVEAQNVVHERDVATIKKEYDHLPELKSQLVTLRSSVPGDDALSSLLDELHALEQQNGVTLTDFKAGDGQPYAPVKSTLKEVNTTNPLITPQNFVAIQIGVQVSGTNANLMSFVQGLQTGSRLFLVTDLEVKRAEPSGTTGKTTVGSDYQATITGLVYVLLDHPLPPKATDTKTAKAAVAPKG